MTATTTAPRQESKKARRQARNLLRRNPAPSVAIRNQVQDLREYAVHSEPRHRMTSAHALRCNAFAAYDQADL